MNEYNTIKWDCTIGVNAGYDLNEQKMLPIEEFTGIYLELAEEVYKETGIYVSATITDSRVLYSPEWGCPKGGEFAFTLSGSCNSAFAEPENYRKSLDILMRRLKKRMNQSTLLLEIVPAKLKYYTGE